MFYELIRFVEFDPILRPVDEKKAGFTVSSDARPSAARAGREPHLPNRGQEIIRGRFGGAR
jgi:hypothetical protein